MPSACSMPRPARAVSANTSAKMPTGAAHSTQCTITIMVSLMAFMKPITCARGASSIRVRAKPKNSANVTKGNIALAAAAAIALLGMMAISELAQPPPTCGCSTMCPPIAAATAGSGWIIESTSGASTAVITAAAVSRTMKVMMALRATRPEWAASLAWLIPTTTSANTSGTTVICKAFSHSLPNGSTMPAICKPRSGDCQASRMPSTMPATRPAMTRLVWLIVRVPY